MATDSPLYCNPDAAALCDALRRGDESARPALVDLLLERGDTRTPEEAARDDVAERREAVTRWFEDNHRRLLSEYLALVEAANKTSFNYYRLISEDGWWWLRDRLIEEFGRDGRPYYHDCGDFPVWAGYRPTICVRWKDMVTGIKW
jgi:hypothetical protein